MVIKAAVVMKMQTNKLSKEKDKFHHLVKLVLAKNNDPGGLYISGENAYASAFISSYVSQMLANLC